MPLSIDVSHSNIAFSVRHMMFAKVRGQFTRWSATVTDEGGRLTGVEVVVDVGSVDTREPQRDGHLRSADFFDAENHPQMTFSGRAQGDVDANFTLVGDLTIRGTTRPATLQVEFLGAGKDPWGNPRRGYRATTRVNRHDFGLDWNAALEMGGVLVGADVDIEIDVEVVGA